MPLRLSSFVALVFLALTVVVGVQAATSANGEDSTSVSRFQRINPASISKVAGWKPASFTAKQQTTVILQMSGAPVASRVGDAQDRGADLTKAQRDAIRAELKGRQDAIRGAIQAAGGQVLNAYQDAYNGLSVRIAAKDVAKLASLSGVTAVRFSRTYRLRPDDVAGNTYIGGPQAWQNTGFTGKNVKVAVIDTGVDYTHKNFGGPGTVAAFTSNNPTVIEAGTFPTAKVIGGFDFVGNDYDADSDDPANQVPHPDPDPLDCNGHGSHVAGIATGFGVTADGQTYTGPYNGSTMTSNNWTIGPGVAPEALVLAYKVFGCEGSVSDDIVVAAINRAVEDGANVINMSLGAPFGRPDSADGDAANNAARAGVIVVTSAGNEGPNAYMTGSPGTATRVISTAAIDASSPTFPGATLNLNTGVSITAINANSGGPLPGPNTPILVLRNADGTVSLGCNPAEYAGAAGKIVVTQRGTCARVARAIFGQQAGAVAVVMINNVADYPPYEGPIHSNPDTGEPYDVTIPFLGVRGVLGPAPTDDGDQLILATSAVSTTPTEITNTSYEHITSFSSGGPRNVDSAIKPDIAAPGQAVISTGVGTGDGPATISGTSQASPHVAGSAALMRQAHPNWNVERIKGALMNTAKDPVPSLNVRTGGAGVVQIQKAIDSQVVATTGGGTASLSYGYQPLGGAYSQQLGIRLANTGTTPVTYNLSATGLSLGLGLAFSPSTVTVPARGNADVKVTASMSAASVAALPGMSTFTIGWGAVLSARGLVLATPTTSGAGIYTLRVPWLVVPRGLSNVAAGPKSPYTRVGDNFATNVNLTNNGVHSGTADVYSWGIADPNDTVGGEDNFDVRDVGVQEQPTEFLTGTPDPNDRALVFAINNYGRWSNASVTEFDIAINTNSTPEPEFTIVGADFGAITTGTFNGQIASFIVDAAGNIVDAWVPDAPMNGSTIELPTLASEIGMKGATNKFTYTVQTFSIVPGGGLGDVTGVGTFGTLGKAPVSTGNFLTIAPGASSPLQLLVDKSKLQNTPVRGWLVVSLDDRNGAAQADEVPLGNLPAG